MGNRALRICPRTSGLVALSAAAHEGPRCGELISPDTQRAENMGKSMKYYLQFKRPTDPFYRTYGSLNSAREVMEALRTGRQLDSNLHYIWARYHPDITITPKPHFLPIAFSSRGPETT